MTNDTDITTIPDATLWAELIRRTVERERTGEDSIWPKVTLEMAYGTAPRGLHATCETCDWVTSGGYFSEVTASIVEHTHKTGHENVWRDDETDAGVAR